MERKSLRSRINKKLKAHKWKLLGSGAMAQVHGKDEYPWVVKIGDAEDPWVEYAYLILSGEVDHTNPYLPRIKKLIIPGDGYYYAIMERLDETLADRRRRLSNALPGDIGVGSLSEEHAEIVSPEMFEAVNLYKKHEALYKHMRNEAEFNRRDWDLDENEEPIELDYNAKNVVFALQHFFNSRNGTDMHSNNVMYRGDQLVITDPVYSNDCYKIRRARKNTKRKVFNLAA